MNRSRFSHRLCLIMVVVGFLLVAGCSDQATNQAANQSPNQSSQPANASPAPNKAAAPKAKVVPVSAKVMSEPPQPITIPKGTAITATMGETLASDKIHKGDTFAATLSSPVTLDGKTILPKGAHLTGRVVTVKKHELRVALASIKVHGKSYDLATNSLRPSDTVKPAKSGNAAAAQDNSKNADKQKKDNSTLSAKSQLTFKLAKPVTLPAKG